MLPPYGAFAGPPRQRAARNGGLSPAETHILGHTISAGRSAAGPGCLCLDQTHHATAAVAEIL